MEQKINIKQIAALAGVSVATVSRVINQNGRFSPETEEKVRKLIEQYGYVPDAVAKGLRTSRMQAVGVVVPDIVNNHFARLVLALETAFFAAGYSTVICNTNENDALEEKHVRTLTSQRVVGILFISGSRRYDLGRDVPVLYLDRRPALDGDCRDAIVIESDNENGGYLAAQSLLRRGRKQIAVLAASSLDHNHRARAEGCARALREAGVEPNPALQLTVGEVSYRAAWEAVLAASARGVRFDAVLCTADALAVGAILALKSLDLRVPEDVAVTGFDDSDIAAVYDPTITSVRQDVDEMAARAVRVLLDLLEGRRPESPRILLPVELVERGSSGGVTARTKPPCL